MTTMGKQFLEGLIGNTRYNPNEVFDNHGYRAEKLIRQLSSQMTGMCPHKESMHHARSRMLIIELPMDFPPEPEWLSEYFRLNVTTPAWIEEELEVCRRNSRSMLVTVSTYYNTIARPPDYYQNGVGEFGPAERYIDPTTHTNKLMYPTGTGHISLLLFDLKRSTQEYWDSNFKTLVQNNDEYTRIHEAIRTHTFLPGFAVVDIPRFESPIGAQGIIERRIGIRGICTLMCTVVGLLHVRFGIMRLSEVARVLLRISRSDRTLLKRFSTWMTRVGGGVLGDVVLTTAPSEWCSCISAATGNLCSRKSCGEPNSVFCWQHRFLWQNVFGESRKCRAPQVKWPLTNVELGSDSDDDFMY